MAVTPEAAGSSPVDPANYRLLVQRLAVFTLGRLQHVSTPEGKPGVIEQADGAFDRRGTQVHVPLRRDQILMPGEFLNRPRRGAPHRQM